MLTNATATDGLGRVDAASGFNPYLTKADASAVSWGAIFAGAAAAAALSLILLVLGTGLGLSSVSPWAKNGISATAFGVTTIVWITFTQLAASGMGGYIAGRLRTKWVAVHSDEVYFRDTAHGFLAWAVASLVTAALLTSVIGTIISGGIQAGASVAGGVASTATAATAGGAAAAGSEMAKSGSDGGPMGYFVDYLFRKDIATNGEAAAAENRSRSEIANEHTTIAQTSEVARIFMSSLQTGALAEEDVKYVGSIVSKHTGLSQQKAEKRVSDTFARIQAKLHSAEVAAKNAANKARKASAYAALWIFVSLLGGAFVASLAATFGGRRRDL
ncbi:MAG: hypothetical protein WAT12_00030 [Candidatus Nitrotoga sp.]